MQVPTLPPEIAVLWEPKHPQSTIFYDIPKGEVRRADLSVRSRVGVGVPVRMTAQAVTWLSIPKNAVHEAVPPFRSTIQVDTTDLAEGFQYRADLIFEAFGQEIWRESVRVFVDKPEENSSVQTSVTANSAPRAISFLIVATIIVLFFLVMTAIIVSLLVPSSPPQAWLDVTTDAVVHLGLGKSAG